MRSALPFVVTPEDEVELTVVDLGLARALWEGVPSGRLLARIRLHRDERDPVVPEREAGEDLDRASWDTILARLLAASPPSLDRVKRAVARHARTASDEGPLAASDHAIAALVHAHLSSGDVDASPAEGAADAVFLDDAVRAACGRFDGRLGRTGGDGRPAAFEACLELAKHGVGEAWPLEALCDALAAIASAEAASIAESGAYPKHVDGGQAPELALASTAPLYPWNDAGEVSPKSRRACLLDRAVIERVLLVPERELTSAIARAAVARPELPVAKIAADAAGLLSKHGALLLVATREPRSQHAPPPLPPGSWQPPAPDETMNAASLAAALERGSLTAPRARALLLQGGDSALDAIGKEMLEVSDHPFASAVFAEVLAPVARERDVVRLVTYFAIAPDPGTAARALDLCAARELVATVLRSWLETMLPSDGGLAEPGTDPGTSTSARVASCIAALRPYPGLYAAVAPLLSRISELPPA